jgi:hypothetical protein
VTSSRRWSARERAVRVSVDLHVAAVEQQAGALGDPLLDVADDAALALCVTTGPSSTASSIP